MYHLKLIDLSLAKIVILEHILHINHAIVIFLIHLLIFFSLNREYEVLTNWSWI